MTRSHVLLVLIPAMLAAGCGRDADPLAVASLEGEAGIRTDATVYRVAATADWYEVTIGVTYTNRTPFDVHLPTCHVPHPPLLERLGPGGWTVAYDPPVLLCLGVPVIIRPGGEQRLSYRVLAGRRPNHYPQLDVAALPGTYRVNWTALHIPGGALPESHRTSNAFELRMQE